MINVLKNSKDAEQCRFRSTLKNKLQEFLNLISDFKRNAIICDI